MATSAQQVFERAMAIADEVGSGGTFTSSDLNEYKDRTPFILTMLEAEFGDKGIAPTTYTLTDEDEPFASADGTELYVRVTLPTGFRRMDNVKYEDDYGRFCPCNWRMEGNSTLLLNPITSGKFNITYYAHPTPITALTGNMNVYDDIAASILPYGLAAELFKVENEYIFNYASARFLQLKKDYRKPCSVIDMVDCYRW